MLKVDTFTRRVMSDRFPLVPRYQLDDAQGWLVGIDPLRRYWLLVNGDEAKPIILPGLSTDDFDQFKKAIFAFRKMVVGDVLELPTAAAPLLITCVSKNCFVIDFEVDGYLATHLFDQASLEALLMTAHPDWQCSRQRCELGQQRLTLAQEQSADPKVA